MARGHSASEGKGKMVGWDIYSKILNLDFLDETEKMQYQASASGVSEESLQQFTSSRL